MRSFLAAQSEQVLVEYWVTSTSTIKKCCIKVTISQQHGDRAS
jgi:hypothetical protein